MDHAQQRGNDLSRGESHGLIPLNDASSRHPVRPVPDRRGSAILPFGERKAAPRILRSSCEKNGSVINCINRLPAMPEQLENIMRSINSAYAGLSSNYLFSEVARRVRVYKEHHPGADVISLGIGDVSQPLVPAVIEALHKAVDEMGHAETFRGYGPEQGYAFLREAILEHDFLSRGVKLDADEIFISDGAKSDVGNFQELFGSDAVIALTDPVYPVYEDSNAMAGRAGVHENGRWSRIVYLPCTKENNFCPALPEERVDVVYLCIMFSCCSGLAG